MRICEFDRFIIITLVIQYIRSRCFIQNYRRKTAKKSSNFEFLRCVLL